MNKKTISLCDTSGALLYSITDGHYLDITYPHGYTAQFACHWLNENKFFMGQQSYDPSSFFSEMEQKGITFRLSEPQPDRKMIRMTNWKTREAVEIPDGGSIRVYRPDINETFVSKCIWCDSAHTFISGEPYHNDQFMSLMHSYGATITVIEEKTAPKKHAKKHDPHR